MTESLKTEREKMLAGELYLASDPELQALHLKDNTTIGAGSVVTKNIPENVVAVGNPCRVIRDL